MGSIECNNEQLASVLSKYAEERDKRLRADGLDQYADVRDFKSYKHFANDPWCSETGDRQWQIPTGIREGRSKVVIVGSGFGGLTYAARILLNTKVRPEDIVLIDNAAGFGGAWYWNRYPGLMCDVESAIYMPLLEETGHIPKHRYAYGAELRAHAEDIATQFKLQDRALWKATVKAATWDEDKSEWMLKVEKQGRDKSTILHLRTEFFVLTAGLLHNPKLPKLPGIEDYAGHSFHTARWDYNYTGGSPTDTTLSGLKGKTVIFVGTGATGIQVIPQLATWAKELYVIQRTAASVDVRGQHAIDATRFQAEVSNKKGWQKARRENFAALVSNTECDVDLVQDAWTTFQSYSALIGGPHAKGLTASTAEGYNRYLQELDLPRQERIRTRVDEIVKDRKTAASLKAWYSGWCKRPCFHDDYLSTFNRPNVHLVDTRGRGIDSFTNTGVVFDGVHYDADVVVFGTGFQPWTRGSPSQRAGFQITGRNGINMDDKWERGISTLHGLLVHDFPNMLLASVNQLGTSVNYTHMADVMATHAARIIATAEERLGSNEMGQRVIIEPTEAAVAIWTDRILETMYAYVGFAGCTPSYTTAEGKAGKSETPEEALREARGLNWGAGLLDFIKVIDSWTSNGKLDGVNVQLVES